jgi:hypothetical protein
MTLTNPPILIHGTRVLGTMDMDSSGAAKGKEEGNSRA